MKYTSVMSFGNKNPVCFDSDAQRLNRKLSPESMDLREGGHGGFGKEDTELEVYLRDRTHDLVI